MIVQFVKNRVRIVNRTLLKSYVLIPTIWYDVNKLDKLYTLRFYWLYWGIYFHFGSNRNKGNK